MTNPHSNIEAQLTSKWDPKFLPTQYCLFTKKQVLFYIILKDFPFLKQSELGYYYYLSFEGFFINCYSLIQLI